ncbi:hypothetical protein Ndes2526B_g06665 [Nannochloris sp. 'desiccata']|nr:putative Protein TRAUCO [Chlorella desiccata (nom. nud.)]
MAKEQKDDAAVPSNQNLREEPQAAAVVENGAEAAVPETKRAVRSLIPADCEKAAPTLAAYEPAPPNRSKKRKAAARAAVPEELIRLGDPIEKNSERLSRDIRHVKLSTEEKAPQIVLDESQLTASSSKGYCTVRCTHGAHSGTWYYEVIIEQLGPTGAVRLGWSTRESEVQAPVGSDGLGYAYRSIQGSRVHEGIREEYGKQFGEGDIVGCLLHMPAGGRPLEKTAEDVVRYRGQLYFTEDDSALEAQPLATSFIEFFVNGESQGRTFIDLIKEGTYYPSISLYTHARQVEAAQVKLNFGATPFVDPPQPFTVVGNEEEGPMLVPLPAVRLPHAAPIDEDDD